MYLLQNHTILCQYLSYFHFFFSFHSIKFALNQDKNHWSEMARLYCSSHGVPEGQPQCKSSPMRKEVQDVAEATETCLVCVCAYVYVCVRVCWVVTGCVCVGGTHMNAHMCVACLSLSVCVCGPLCDAWKIIIRS